MKAIYKYSLPAKEKFSLDLPTGARVIRVEDIDGLFFMWAIIDTEAPNETRNFECYKTGMPILSPVDELVYLGACKLFVMQELCLYVFERVA